MQMPNEIYDIPVTELRPGMTVWKEDGKPGKFKADVYLKDYLLGDYPPREFIYGHRLQFVGEHGQLVTWRNAGRVFVSIGKHK